MDFLYDHSVTCLYCSLTFKTKKPRFSRLPLKSRDTDFYLRYEYINPYVYEALVCPQCGMAFTDKTSPLSDTARDNLASYINQANVENLCGVRTIEQGLKAFKLALICASLSMEPPHQFASLCLKVAWLNRELGDAKEEQTFLKRAYDTFEYIYSEVRFDELKLSESYLLHMLAELSCRLTEPERARRWFGMLFTQGDRGYKYLNEARDRWLEYKEAIKE